MLIISEPGGAQREKTALASLDSSQTSTALPKDALMATTPVDNLDTEKASESAAQDKTKDEVSKDEPTDLKLILITVSLMLAVFCVAIDNTIIAVAIPKITDNFHSLNDVGWYASAYLLTTCSLQLFFGRLYAIFNVKWIFLLAVFLFELGSLICGVAPTSAVLIVGRAIAGLGSAGIFNGALVTLAHIVPLKRRPVFFALIGGMYGIASIAGPLLGGAFTDHATWRWCFYVNLPLGGITVLGIVLLLQLPKNPDAASKGFFETVKGLDPIGTIIFVPAIACLLLALRWGGIEYAWNSARIIALLVVFAVILIAWMILQVYLGEAATVPLRIARQRSIAFASLFCFCLGASFFTMLYFLPIWFQAVLGTSAVRAGVNSLPLLLAEVFTLMVSATLTTKFGYYTPFFIASSVIMSIGAGLITLFTVDTPQSKWVGFQFIYGFGIGCGFQQGNVAAQAVLDMKDVPTGVATVMFALILGGALFISIAQSIFTKNLVAGIDALHIPNLNPQMIVSAGATSLRQMVDQSRLSEVLVAYNAALVKAFQLALIMSCLSVLGAVGVEWISVKEERSSDEQEVSST